MHLVCASVWCWTSVAIPFSIRKGLYRISIEDSKRIFIMVLKGSKWSLKHFHNDSNGFLWGTYQEFYKDSLWRQGILKDFFKESERISARMLFGFKGVL